MRKMKIEQLKKYCKLTKIIRYNIFKCLLHGLTVLLTDYQRGFLIRGYFSQWKFENIIVKIVISFRIR
jgi:ribosomal protein S1